MGYKATKRMYNDKRVYARYLSNGKRVPYKSYLKKRNKRTGKYYYRLINSCQNGGTSFRQCSVGWMGLGKKKCRDVYLDPDSAFR